MTTTGSPMEIHRLLDEAFAGIAMTPDAQDFKEEMRANLVARVADFERSGVPAEEAAQRAVAELGDIRSVLNDPETAGLGAPPWARNRVRPKPAYVVRTVVLAAIAVVALAALVVPSFEGLDFAVPLAGQLAAAVAVALLGGFIVADALRQETTSNYPIPPRRAAGYGVATGLALAGAAAVGLGLRDQPLAWIVGGGLAILVAIVGFTYLGVTQTNRHKPWVVRMHAAHNRIEDRFTEDPAAAARFGLYTAVIWLVALGGFAVLTFTVGWAWSWLALLAGVVAMMLTLARTLFAPTTVDKPGQ